MEKLNRLLWGDFTVIVILLIGVFCTVKSGFVQLRLPFLLSDGDNKDKRKGGGRERLGAVTAALAASMGTGNITGCGAAVAAGGAGAVFWMWVSAFLGMAVSFTENRLGARFAEKYPRSPKGPMLYMEKGLGSKNTARFYALCCIGVAFAMGCMSQTSAFAQSISSLSGAGNAYILRISAGVIMAAVTGAVIFSGENVCGQVMKVTEKAVPIMGLVYAVCCAVLIARSDIGATEAFGEIIACAFTPKAAAGGAVGITVKKAVSVGLRRGVFSNEAGLGSSVLVHGEADFGSPEKTGAWAAFEVFLDTIVCCTLTALAILTSPLYTRGTCDITLIFGDSLGRAGELLACLCIFAFAWAAVLGWCLYGEKCLKYLFHGSRRNPGTAGTIYRTAFCAAAVLGGFIASDSAWDIADIFNWGAMAVNLTAVVALTVLHKDN
ncbi:MAG: amino acid carrier protein [Ruminococcus sp.]|nr:amino acid carrier protein [Ruminococcus sp.]